MPDKLHASEFIGAWQRESISIEGREPYEDSNVLWLHAGDYFADIRWPKPGNGTGPTSAFAGKSFWESPNMRFVHEIDLTKEFDEDTGHLSLLNSQLIEKGKITIGDKVIRFQEVWSRTTTSTVEHCQVAARSDDLGMGYIVRVSDHVIAMEETDEQFSTATWTRDDNKDWILQIGVGDMQGLNVLLDSFVGGSLAAPWVAYTLG